VNRVPGPDDLTRFRHLVAQRLGLQFDDAKLAFLGEVLSRRLVASRQAPGMYLSKLESVVPGEELAALAQELTVGETYFFRNIDQFHALTDVVLPDRMRVQRAHKRLQLLSAGCASGEEAFSLAIMLRRAIVDPAWMVSIRAVDINPAALEKAARGRFTSWALRETPPEIQGTYFRQEGRDIVLEETTRASVTFEQRNLAVDDPGLWQPGAYDVIFCRNTVMYFTPEHAQTLVARITRALAPGGYLFLGHAETLRGLSQQFHLRHTHGTFYYQCRDGIDAVPPQLTRSSSISTVAMPVFVDAVESADSWVDAIRRAAEHIQALARHPAATASTPVAPSPRPDLGLALDLLGQGRLSEALNVVHRFPSESERDPDVLLLKALLLADSGELAAAELACHRLLAVDELNAGAHYILALCREGLGDRSGAADHDQTAAYLDPMFAMPRLHLGMLARRAGADETARRELTQAMLLVQREDASRLLFFGGGFSRATLTALCRAELDACGANP
jgi:chemotaxis protein methyltransferase CheR